MPSRPMYSDPWGFYTPNYQREYYAPTTRQRDYSPWDNYFGVPMQPSSRSMQREQPTMKQQTARRVPPSAPVQQRGVRIPPGNRKVAPTKVSQASLPQYTMEQQEDAAKLIQTAFRMHSVQKQNIIPTLKQLKQIRATIDRAMEKFKHQQAGGGFRGDHLRQMYLQHEEDLTKALLSLDGISVRNSEYLRERRKELVRLINDRLQDLDAKKPEIFARAKQEQLEIQREREEKRRQEELEREAQRQLELEKLALEQSSDELEIEEDESSDISVGSQSDDDHCDLESKPESSIDSDFVMIDAKDESMDQEKDESFVELPNNSAEILQLDQELLAIQQQEEKLLEQKRVIEQALQELASRRQTLVQKRESL